MRPADKVALLTALVDGAKAELDRAKAEALAVADSVGVKSFATPFGSVTVAQRAAAPFVSEPDMLLEWVRDAFPTEVVTVPAVRPAFVTALLSRVEWDPDLGEFIDPNTGEAVPGLDWSAPGEPYVTWPAGDAQKAAKSMAREWFALRSDEVLSALAITGPVEGMKHDA
jgi:hypothetical protein